ncbi:MAG: hypothetical protein GXO91_05450 [FCB group bacterium]|nr:hypothetical protein [FCB group bacterium]
MKKTLLLIPFLFFALSQTYNAGDIISDNHQNQVFDTCYGDYPGGQLTLADFNGAVNGGDYYILFIDMAASW